MYQSIEQLRKMSYIDRLRELQSRYFQREGVLARCKCCGLTLNKAEIQENQGKCFHCIKGNCPKCK